MKNPSVTAKISTQTVERMAKISVKRNNTWKFISPSRFVERKPSGDIYQIVEDFGLVDAKEKDPANVSMTGKAGDYVIFKNNTYTYLPKETYDLKKRTPRITKQSIKNSTTIKSDPQLITKILNNL